MIHIYHHFDADGYAAAAIIASMCVTEQSDAFVFRNEDVKFHSCIHDRPLDLELFDPKCDTMYIVDYSFSREDDQKKLIEMLRDNPGMNFIWIDHHKTSKVIIASDPIFEEILKKDGYVVIPEERNGKTHMNYSGAMLAYFYVINRLHMIFNKNDAYSLGVPDFINHTETYLENLYEKAPEWIRLISDHDTFRHEIPMSSEFVKGATEEGFQKVFLNIGNPNSFISIFYMTIVKPLVSKDHSRNHIYDMILRNRTAHLCEVGSKILKWEDGRNARLIASNAFEARLHITIPPEYIDPNNELKLETDENGMINREALILCYNGHGNSRVFLDNFEKYDAVAIFSFNGKHFVYSIFSKKDGFQCNVAALYFGKHYGINGGGHDHAAGWSSNELTFRSNCDHYATDVTYTCKSGYGWPERWKHKVEK